MLEDRTGKDDYILTTIGPRNRQREINYQEHIRAVLMDSAILVWETGRGDSIPWSFLGAWLLSFSPRIMEQILRHRAWATDHLLD